MPTLFVTGANRGIGREIVKQYSEDGWRVIAACREPALADLTCETVELDVADGASVETLAHSLGGTPIDLLWNNAGIYPDKGLSLEQLNYDDWLETMNVNALAPIRLATALADNVAASDKKLMAFTSSSMASIGLNEPGGYGYRSSKAALNMAVTCLTHDMKPKGIACALIDPGWVVTDMGGEGADIDAQTSVSGMKQVLDGFTLDKTGAYLTYQGDRHPW
jgi:NAD(P)-dependent dehydrogenase (short-subunit alcohol dehydrogenase family)